MGRISRVMNYVQTTPWAIVPRRAAVMFEVLQERAAKGKIVKRDVDEVLEASAKERQARIDAANSMTERTGGMVAVVPVIGTFVHRAYEVNSVSGGGLMSSEQLAADLSALDANPDITNVVLDINSPGGSVLGMSELVATVRGMSTPVTAVANAQAGSAAYWLASAANEVVVTPSGEVGSIGVIAIHEDWSAHLEKEGVDVSVMTAGRFKGEGHPYGPMSEEAKAAMQGRLDDYYDQFTGSVAAGRGSTPEKVRGGFGEGRMVGAEEAVRQGMADRIATLGEVVDGLARAPVARSRRGRRAEDVSTPELEDDPGVESAPDELAVAPAATADDAVALRELRRRRFEMGV